MEVKTPSSRTTNVSQDKPKGEKKILRQKWKHNGNQNLMGYSNKSSKHTVINAYIKKKDYLIQIMSFCLIYVTFRQFYFQSGGDFIVIFC